MSTPLNVTCPLCGGAHLGATDHSSEELKTWEAIHRPKVIDRIRREYAAAPDLTEGRWYTDDIADPLWRVAEAARELSWQWSPIAIDALRAALADLDTAMEEL